MKHLSVKHHQSDHLKFIASSNVMFRELEAESVLLNLNDESYYSLNQTGTMIWKELITSQSIQLAYKNFQEQFKEDETLLASDFNHLLNLLLEKQFGTLEPITKAS